MKRFAILSALVVSLLALRAGAADAPPLQVTGAGVKTAAFAIADLQAMKPVETTWTAGGRSTPVVGVPLDQLLERQGLSPKRMGDDGTEHGKGWHRVVIASAPDGFQAVFTVAELTAHMGATRALVAWKLDGKPLPPDRGPLRLVVLTDKIASRSVHSVSRLEVMVIGKPQPPGAGHAMGHGSGHAAHGSPSPAGSADEVLAKVSDIHGAAGPFAVAGYRMGQRALRELSLTQGSVDLEVRHESPAEVQFSCIADGAQAATGASAGKLNLSLKPASREKTRTIFRRKSTGRTVVGALQPAFVKRFLDLPRDQLDRAGREIMAMADEEIFTLQPR
jgi:formylmethanofuran dehydrogenase subunit E